MAATASERSFPRFNHVALSLAPDELDAGARAEILRFYSEVFGWSEMPGLTLDRERLVLRAHSNEQFVFLVADPEPMRCPRGDHFGMSVATRADFDELLARVRAFAGQHPGVEIDGPHSEDFKVLMLHSFYVRYRLPLRIEVQHFAWAAGMGADRVPRA
jgi:hypothetical protein